MHSHLPTSNARVDWRFGLDFGIWECVGAWSLDLGI
jgi:hypothetical protein